MIGGHLSLKSQDTKDVARELAADKASGGHNLQIFVLSKKGVVYVWDETRPSSAGLVQV